MVVSRLQNDEKAARLKKVDESIVDWPSAKLGKLVAPTFRWLVRRGDLLMITAATPSGAGTVVGWHVSSFLCEPSTDMPTTVPQRFMHGYWVTGSCLVVRCAAARTGSCRKSTFACV